MLARVLRIGITVVPVGVSMAVNASVVRLIARPTGTAAGLVWWVALLGVGLWVWWCVTQAARRLLPLSLLLGLTLVFPDRAPSRLRVAMRASTQRNLEHLIEGASSDSSPGEEVDAAEKILALLAALQTHDRRTRGHSERVRAYTKLLADELPLTDDERNRLQWAGMLHDIGKITVSPAILNKNGRPTDDEWQAIRGHPEAATAFLAPLAGWLGEWIHAADQHHEHWDGSGYPRGLAGKEISRAGRIVAVADAFEVMTAARSYKRPMPASSARAELMRCADTHFDPAMVRAFLNVSLDDLRSVMGPVSLLAQMPVLAGLREAGQAAGNLLGPIGQAAAASATAAALVATVAVSQIHPANAIATTASAASDPAPQTAPRFLGEPASSLAPGSAAASPNSNQVLPSSIGAGQPIQPPAGTGLTNATTTTRGSGSTNTTNTTTPTAPTSTTTWSPPTTTTTTTTTINTAPVAVADALSAPKKKPVLIPVLANDFDLNGDLDPLSVTIVSGPTGPGTKMGTLSVVNVAGTDQVNYAAPDTKGVFTFTYSVCDNASHCSTANVAVTLS